jgi:hypothetical protein
VSGFGRLSILLFSLVALAISGACGPADHAGRAVFREDDAVRAVAGNAGATLATAGARAPTPVAAGSEAGSFGAHAADSGRGSAGNGGASGAGVISGSAGAPPVAGSAGVDAEPTAGSGGSGLMTTGMNGATSEGAGSGTGSGLEGGAGVPGSAGPAAGGGAAPTPSSGDCDLTGVWIARLTTFSRDAETYSVQTASNWFYYELEQSGRDVTVVKGLDCGLRMSGSADVTLTHATTRALIHPNDQAGRRGKFYKDSGHCAFRFERFYSTRGLPRATYLPADTSHDPALSSLEMPLPTEQVPSGAEDWDEDGQPGITLNVAQAGARDVVQRDWNEFWTDETTTVPLRADEFVARADFDSEESILSTSGGFEAPLRTTTTPATDMRHRILFRRVARSLAQAAAETVRTADDLETCYNVQAALPHDPSME